MTTINDPLENAHILAKSGPQELAVVILAKPVDRENARRVLHVSAGLQPVIEIVADVVAAER